MRTPSNLTGHAIPLPPQENPDIERTFALGSAAGEVGYEIYYFGEVFIPEWETDGRCRLIVSTRRGEPDSLPALVVARPIGSNGTSDVLLFDGGAHGYDAMFAEEHDPEALATRTASQRLEIDGETQFAVTITVYDNIDWDEEESDFHDENGIIRLITGEAIDSERLRADGYDAIGIDVIDAHGVKTEILNEELA